MIKIKLKKILFNKGIEGLTIFPFIFLREDKADDPIVINHEKIHIRQQMELLLIPFYLWYFYESGIKQYASNMFEKEAYANESNFDYLKSRPWFNFKKYK